jgi:hypothetical protein
MDTTPREWTAVEFYGPSTYPRLGIPQRRNALGASAADRWRVLHRGRHYEAAPSAHAVQSGAARKLGDALAPDAQPLVSTIFTSHGSVASGSAVKARLCFELLTMARLMRAAFTVQLAGRGGTDVALH